MRPLRLCILTHLYPVSPDDYKGIFVHQIAALLASRGHEVHVVTPRRPDGIPLEVRDGVTIHRHWWWGWRRGVQLGQLRGTPPLMLGTLVLVGLFRAIRIVLRHRLDLVHAYWVVPGGFMAWLTGRLTRRPVVATAAGTDLNISAQRPLIRPFVLRTLRGVDRLIAAGSEMERLAVELGADPAHCIVLPSLVPPPPDAEPPELPPAGPPGRRLIYVGNFDPPKRIDTLLKAFSHVLAMRADARLTLVGEGALRADLEALATQLGIAGRVDFRGRVPHEQVLPLMSAADIFLHCSDNEGLPVAIHEALTAGLPVVAARVGGIPDLVREGETGRLHDPDDHGGFARSILELLERTELRRTMAANALRYAQTHLQQDVIIERMESLFQELSNPRSA